MSRLPHVLTFSTLGLLAACSSTPAGDDAGDVSGASGSTTTGGSGSGGVGLTSGAAGTGGTSSGAGGTGTGGSATGGSATGGAGNGGVGTAGVGNAGGSGGGNGGGTGGMADGGAGAAGAPSGGNAGASGTGATGGAAGAGGMGAPGGAGAGGAGTGGTAGAGGAGMGGAGTGGAGSGGKAGAAGSAGSSGNPGGVTGEPVGFATLNGGTTGGRAGSTVTVTNLADLQRYAGSAEPYVILVQGTISNGSSGARVSVKSNKSIVGVGASAFLSGVGLEIASSNNVIIQNLKATLVGTSNPSSVNGGDVIVVNGTSKNVWIDHCELYSEDPDVQTNIDKYDGLIDIRDQTGFITVSWNYIHDHHKGCLVGASDTDLFADRKITYHHNHFHKIIKRMPMYRGAVGHFFNNYVYGTSATEATFVLMDTCLRVEKNVYENVRYAIYSQTGSTAGSAERIDNIGSQSRAYPSSCTADIPYSYSSALTSTTSTVKALVTAGAGVGKL